MERLPTVGIIGSRDYPDLDAVRAHVRSLPSGTMVLTGADRTVGVVAEDAARERGLWLRVYALDLMSTVDIIRDADRLVAFWDGRCRITQLAIEIAERKGKEVLVSSGPRPPEDRILKPNVDVEHELLRATIATQREYDARMACAAEIRELKERVEKYEPSPKVDRASFERILNGIRLPGDSREPSR